MRRLALLFATLCRSPSRRRLPAQQWVASWTGSAHGPYPIGNPTAQPELKFAFPRAEQGARDQTFRLIVKPDVWGPQARIRLSNAFGTKPVTFDGVLHRPAGERQRDRAGHQPAAAVRRPEERHRRARPERGERSGGAAVREDRRRPHAARPQARGQLPRRGRERADDLARQGAADLLHQPARQRRQGRRRTARPRSPSRPPRGTSSTRSTCRSLPANARSSSPSAIRSPTARAPRSTATTAGPTCCRAACTPPTATASSW